MDMKVAVVPMTSIAFGERFRKDYGDMDELVDSIKSRGLIQPLAVCINTEDNKYDYSLLAGGRRYMALTMAKIADVAVRIYPADLDPLEKRSIELAENLKRKDMDWKEQVDLQREIHELQIELHGEKVSTAPDASGWSIKDTAEMVGASKSSVQKDLAIAKAVDAAPEIFESCKSKSDAAKMLEKVQAQLVLEEMAKRAKKDMKHGNLADIESCYVVESAIEYLPKLEAGSCGFAEIDPPYAIDLQKAKKVESGSGVTDHYNEIDGDVYEVFMRSILEKTYRVLSPHSWAIVWFAPEPYFEQMYQWIIDAGFTTNRMCGIWVKPSGQSKQPATNLANSYEMFFICKKGSPVLVKQGRTNVFNFAPVPGQKKVHPTERPIEMMNEILSTFCTPGTRIIVPFLGSGNTILSANQVGMTAFGTDISKEYKDRFTLKVHKGV
jgi:site-specific DNA-methyltransferase (adenine-specific)